jgi:hypothetical protein
MRSAGKAVEMDEVMMGTFELANNAMPEGLRANKPEMAFSTRWDSRDFGEISSGLICLKLPEFSLIYPHASLFAKFSNEAGFPARGGRWRNIPRCPFPG